MSRIGWFVSFALFGLTLGQPMVAASLASEGRWTMLASGRDKVLLLTMQTNPESSSSGWVSREVKASDLRGVSRRQIENGHYAGTFEVVRDAGTFRCEGTIKHGKGSGEFVFVPDPSYATELAKRGIGRPNAGQQFDLALHDVGFELIDELARQGYVRPSVAHLVEIGRHGVDLEYVRGMDRAGFRLASTAELVRMRDHGVDQDFIQELENAGYRKLSLDEVLRARDHGVDGNYISGMARLGYHLPLDDLVRARDHGVDPEYLQHLSRRGVTNLTLEQAIAMRDHGTE